ncbi:neuroendocrine convertase 1 [Anaeramoeba flamelloides]|uniref:Neuroendocrine convertase 1 n=1 Tax=Anaeramoeba flamelloides TaxID=1746091 RepID=A0ABQ8X0U7_9EUKA|nr:neuroendocrine convertase 1 [Anaeramoeba flamelloides]
MVKGINLEGEYVVHFPFGVDPEEIANQAGFRILKQVKIANSNQYYVLQQDPTLTYNYDLLEEIAENITPNRILYYSKKDIAKTGYSPDDYLYADQFHLTNTGQFSSRVGIDANVKPVWDEGNLGSGVVVAVVDDGLLSSHEDISPNFLSEYSYDFCNDKDDPSPTDDENSHGTACGGVCCGANDGNTCGVGAAPEAQIVGRSVLCGATTSEFAQALGDNCESIHVSTNSWGPSGCDSSSCYFFSASYVEENAIIECSEIGRSGLGTIYLFAAGNEREDGGDVNQYGLTKLPQVITVAAIGPSGSIAYYSNEGSGILVSATSSGYNKEDQYTGIRTTTTGSTTSCTTGFGGTSSATPLVAGVVALILSENPQLTYWDIQGILIESARHIETDDESWQENGAEYYYSHDYGFGLVNAEQATILAQTWESYENLKNWTSTTYTVNMEIPDNDETGITVNFDMDLEENNITIIGGVVMILSIDHDQLGNVDISLTSPFGTVARLAKETNNYQTGITSYPFIAKCFYGELSQGSWKLQLKDLVSSNTGQLIDWQVKIYGIEPQDKTKIPYDDELPEDVDEEDDTDDSASVNMDQLITIGVVIAGVVVLVGLFSLCFRKKKEDLD